MAPSLGSLESLPPPPPRTRASVTRAHATCRSPASALVRSTLAQPSPIAIASPSGHRQIAEPNPGSRGGGGHSHSHGGGGGGKTGSSAKPGAADKNLHSAGQVELENRVAAFLEGKTDAQKAQVNRESQFHASNPRFHHHYLNQAINEQMIIRSLFLSDP